MKDQKRTILLICLPLLAAATLVASAASVTAYAYQNRVLPRTIVAGLPIGNLTRVEAEALILQKEAELSTSELTVAYQDQTEQIALSDLGVTIAGPEQEVVNDSSNFWDWASPMHWKKFFGHKQIGLRYNLDADLAQKKVESVFGVTTTAKNAEVVVANGALLVNPSQAGESLGLTSVIGAIESLLSIGQSQAIVVDFTNVDPSINTEAANRTKTEIESALQPVYLIAENKSYVIPKASLYETVAFEPKNGELTWQISDEKLQAYLSSKIIGKISVKMVEKNIQSDTLEITQQGRDGKVVDTATLVSAVKRTITEQVPTKQAPLPIQVRTVPFTEKVVSPEYVAGLFEGLYVDINLTKQKMFIMIGQTKTAQFLISSGKAGKPSPTGLLYIKNKIADPVQSRLYPGIWMRQWNALARNADGSGYEGFGIHDLPAFNKEYTLIEGASHLGHPVSHGCIRLGHDNAVWFFNNIPIGTPINIHK